jgi:hypothetical protein
MMKNGIPVVVLIVCLSLFGCSEAGTGGSYYTYTLTFNGNGAEGTPPQAVSVPADQGAPIPGKGGFEYTGKVFWNWNTKADGSGKSCNPGDKEESFGSDTVLYAQWKDKKPGEEYKTFWARDTSDNWYTVEAVKGTDEGNCIIYADILETVSEATINRITDEYNDKIYGTITGAFGSAGKVILLLLDIKDGYSGGSEGYVAGYFDATHMYTKATYSVSNEARMLFIDVDPGLKKLSQLYSTIAHELQHLINYSQTVLTKKSQKDLWIDEGLSTAAEYICYPSDKSRIEYFNSSNTRDANGNYGTIAYGNNFFIWNGYWEQTYGDVLADYATAYLFFSWLGIHASNTGIYKDIINNSNGNYLSVTAAASSRIGSQFSNWETLLGTWMAANYYNSSSGVYGYSGKIRTRVLVFTDTGHTAWSFSPGEGIFSKQSGSFSAGPNTGPNIRYRGLGSANSPPVEIPPYDGTTLLTFNANTNKDGHDETGYLASVAETGTGTGPALSVLPAGPSVRAAGRASGGETPYPVSFGDKAAGLDKPGKFAPGTR